MTIVFITTTTDTCPLHRLEAVDVVAVALYCTSSKYGIWWRHRIVEAQEHNKHLVVVVVVVVFVVAEFVASSLEQTVDQPV